MATESPSGAQATKEGPRMVSVLFVDDDAAVLRALRETYDGRGYQDWETVFVPGADAALEAMAARPVDAVVASTRLLGMGAPSLLRLTKQQYPKTARIALSEPGDRSAMLGALALANQCLSKACSSEVLAKVVRRTTRLQGKLFSDATRRVVAEVGTLPSLPSRMAELDAALANEECSLGEIADIMSGDVAMVAKVLHLVNSSFFGLRARINDLRQAVAYLGVETLRDFALAGAAFRAFVPSPLLPDGWLLNFEAHSLAVADISGQLVRTSLAQCEANVAGMLHDIGELVVADRAPAKVMAVADDVSAGMSPDEAETHHIGTTYPVIGGYLLSLWGTGYHLVEAITCQREVWQGTARDPELADVVRVADYLAAHASPDRDDAREAVTDRAGAKGRKDLTPARVYQSSTLMDLDEDYQDRVGLLGAVRLYNEGSVHLR